MSTNDTVLVLANGAAGAVDADVLAAALDDLCTDLAQQIVRDGEGATKFISVRAQRGVGRRCAAGHESRGQLAAGQDRVYGGDELGRILAAVGYSGAAVDSSRAHL